MQLPSQVAKLKQVVQRYGLSGLGVHVGRRAMTVAPGGETRRMFLFALSKATATKRALDASKGHEFRFATTEDMERLRQDPESRIFDRDVEAQKSGNRCLLQFDGDVLAGYSWAAKSHLIELLWGYHFNMPDDMVYNYNGYTNPVYRGKGFQGLRHVKMLEHVQATGGGRLFGYVDHMNYSSLHGLAKSGYEQIGVLRGSRRNGGTRFSLSVADASWSEMVRAGPQQTG